MNIEKIMLEREKLYSKYATFDKESIRLKEFTPDIRPNYFRDIDRIIHTKSYTRYMDKTQVFTRPENDHIQTRMVHVQLVSKIGRTIGRALSLNEDLIEAIALGHDLGHIPFGHVGERILSKLSLKHNEGYFHHNVQSARNLMVIEDLNISIQVLDGILCHNGEITLDKYYPKEKSTEDFLNDLDLSYTDENHELVPMTLEGCVVKISDIIAYLGRDIEDAIELGIIKIEDLPKSVTKIIGDSNKNIINNIILDLIKNSYGKPYLKVSDYIYKAIEDLKEFNYEYIYYKANSKESLLEIENMFNIVFETNLYFLNNDVFEADIYNKYLNNMNDEYKRNNTNERKVIDYIAGMTDAYFIKEYKFLLKYQ